jgi:hypothetical protein
VSAMMLVNLLQDPKPGRPLMTGRSHRGAPCEVCKSTEKIWTKNRGRDRSSEHRWEVCAACARRPRRRRYESTPKGRAMLARANVKRKRDMAKERAAQNARRWRRRNPEREMFIGAKKRAKSLGLDFTIELCDIVMPEVCPILGIELMTAVGTNRDHSPSLDRKDPTKGYIKGNVWVISWRANAIKRDATLAELRLIVAALERLG